MIISHYKQEADLQNGPNCTENEATDPISLFM